MPTWVQEELCPASAVPKRKDIGTDLAPSIEHSCDLDGMNGRRSAPSVGYRDNLDKMSGRGPVTGIVYSIGMDRISEG